MDGAELERITRKLKRTKRELKRAKADPRKISKIRRAIRRNQGEW